MENSTSYENTEPMKPPIKTISHRFERLSGSKNKDLKLVTELKVKDKKP